MKTKLSLKCISKHICFSLLFFCVTISLFAQCPTISNSAPPAICDASGYTFSDLNSFAIDNGNGIVWYDSPTGGTSFNSNELVFQGTYYADDNTGSCGARASIIIDFQLDPSGENLDRIYCSNESATIQTYIDDVLQGSIPPGGTVAIYNDFDLTNQTNPTDAIPIGASNYYIVFEDTSGCETQIEIGQVGVFSAPVDPTPASPQEFCSDSNPVVGNLDTGTTSTNITWYSSLDGSGDPIPPALSPTTPLVDGNTYYVQIDDIFCVSNPVAVTVTIDTPFEAGNSASLEYCDDSLLNADFDLFDELGGTPDSTGNWTGPIATSNGFRGTVNISTLTIAGTYTFTYTVASAGACPDATANIIITVYETLTSGSPSVANPASFCESGLPTGLDLFSLLENEDPNGLWTQGVSSIDPAVTSPIDLTGFTSGTYNFTYTQNILPNPCPEESTTVQVIVLADPDAGNAMNQTFCENDVVPNSPFNLFDALDGSQDNNSGTWTDATNSTISNSIDITGFTVAGSPYVFTYTIDNGTCSDSEQISITIEDAPESGTANTPVEFCLNEITTGQTYNLFDLLTREDQAGIWNDDDATGALSGNTVTLDGLLPNTYNFTYNVTAIGSCDDVDVTVSIVINPLPNTGTASPATFCENDLTGNSPLDLFSQLSGEATGGTWSDDTNSGALTGSDVDVTLLTIGSYNYTYTIIDTNGCENSSTVIVTIEDAPESGTANTPVEFCLNEITTGQTYNLFDLLTGEDQAGIWNDDDATGALSGNTVTLDGLLPNTYNFTYNVTAIGSCDDVDVTVSMIINDTAVPTAPSVQEFCDSATVSDLSATGLTIQWYDDATGGSPLDTTTDLVDSEDYYVSQTDGTTGCESSIRTQINVTIYQSPNAGNANTTAIIACNDNNSINLFDGLDGTENSGGTWQDDDTTGALSINILDGSVLTPGTYNFTYLVTANAPCVDDSTTITVTIEAPQSAGTGTTIELCNTDVTLDLFTLLGSADTGGTWSPALTSGTGVFDPATDISGIYTYTLSNACSTLTSDIDVTVVEAANAGTDNTLLICVGDATTDLFTLLGADAQTGGTWLPALDSGTGEFDPAVDVSGTYVYTVTAVAPCSPDATAQIIITVEDSPPIIVDDPNPSFCLIDAAIVSDLENSIQATGTVNWYEDAALTLPLVGTEALTDGEDYYATQTNTSGCESSVAVQIDVTVNDAVTPTLDNVSADYCINDGPTLRTLSENIIEYDTTLNNIVWYDVPTGGTSISEDTTLGIATYYAALIDQTNGCESSVRLEITPDVTACGKISLPDGFSPNGDGDNDIYDIDNLDILYPNFVLEIFNRNGNIVYKGNANSPRFDGTSNQGRVVVKGDLPVGVYFYIFRFNDGVNKPEQGRLYLSR